MALLAANTVTFADDFYTMATLASGAAAKMQTELSDPVTYTLRLGEQEVVMNELIEQPIALQFNGSIHCTNCQRVTKKSFSQGYCFPCFRALAQCDGCIVRPETCHYHAGTCREPAWGEANCFQPHFVYLANSSGLKVGITRHSQIPTRWMDQGATQGRLLMQVTNRLHSGLVEKTLKQYVADRTDWRKMLKGEAEPLNLQAAGEDLLAQAHGDMNELRELHDDLAITMQDQQTTQINYPVKEYPLKVSSHNLDKNPLLEGTLMGIKGQYLIFDKTVINIRKYTGYDISLIA